MSKDIDELLEEVVRSKIDSTITPPKEEIWEKVRMNLKEERKIRPLRYKPIIALCITFIILAVSLTVFDTPVKAFTIKIIKTIEEIAEDTFIIHKIIGTEAGNETNSILTKSDDPRIDEARSKVSFELLIPSYIPENYEFYSLDLHDKEEGLTLLYLNTKDHSNKECIEIVINSFSAGVESRMNYILEDETKIQHLDIDGIEYVLLNYEEFYNVLVWDKEGISYKIDGSISREDIIKIAKSMK